MFEADKGMDNDTIIVKLSSSLRSHKCRLFITFANRLDPDQVRQNARPDLDPICLTLRWYS